MALFSKKNLNKSYVIVYEELCGRICEIATTTIGFELVPNVPMDDSVIFNKDNFDGTVQQEESK